MTIKIERNIEEEDKAECFDVFYVMDLDTRKILTRIDADSLNELQQVLEEESYLFKDKEIEIVQAIKFREM